MRCNECGAPADERYTMDFTDIGEGRLGWCSDCGPESVRMKEWVEAFLSMEEGLKHAKMLEAMVEVFETVEKEKVLS